MKMSHIKAGGIGVLFLLSAGVVPPTAAQSDGALFESALQQFEQARSGSADTGDAAHEKFARLHRAAPDNPLYLAYLGSSETLIARDGWWPWSRIRHLESGLERIDRALELLDTVDNLPAELVLRTRLTALATFADVPAFANRRQDALDLLRESLQSPAFADAPEPIRRHFHAIQHRLDGTAPS